MARFGIHTHIVSETDFYKNHVSISIEDSDGTTKFYGLYPAGSDYLPYSEKKRSYRFGGSDLREDIDKNRPATYSHYADISDEARVDFKEFLVDIRHEYKNQDHHCLDWAMSAWEHTTGQTIDATQIIREGGIVSFQQTPIGLEEYLRARDHAPARIPIKPVEEKQPSPGLLDRLKNILGAFFDQSKTTIVIDQLSPEQETQKKELQAKAAAYREETRSILWYEPEELARTVSELHSQGNEMLDRLDPYEAKFAREEILVELEEAVAAGKAEKRWTTRDEPYYQFFDDDGYEGGIAILPRGRGEKSPAELERRRAGIKMPLRDARRSFDVEYKSGEYRPPSAAKDEPKKKGRSEYQPGSHKPAPKEPGRDKDDRGGRGD
ncbi:MAG: hypothetical protein ACK5NY_09330 [Burkholderiaceae bacterium]